MSILIKNMEMPTSCYLCPCNKDDGFGFFTCGVTHYDCDFMARPAACPLIPVPPHGRLIDADALEDRCSRLAEDEWNKSTCTSWGYAYASFANDVEDAPTIIEAEGNEK